MNETDDNYEEKEQGERCPNCNSIRFNVYKQGGEGGYSETVGECLDCGYTETT